MVLFLLVAAVAATSSAQASTPQDRVLCSGPHVLCSLAPCEIKDDATAICRCVEVNDTYAVSLSEIRNDDVSAATKARCTASSPCSLDSAPVCEAIKRGNIEFGSVRVEPGMVSTFSWGGWCSATEFDPSRPAVCSPSPWAACMTAPCRRNKDGGGSVDCQCTWQNSSWIDFRGGGKECSKMVSSVPADFDMQQMPFASQVLGACAKIWP